MDPKINNERGVKPNISSLTSLETHFSHLMRWDQHMYNVTKRFVGAILPFQNKRLIALVNAHGKYSSAKNLRPIHNVVVHD